MMTENQLIEKSKEGDEQAFNQIVHLYKNLIYHIILSLVKDQSAHDDLFQDILIKVFKRLASFEGRSKLSTWISKIAYNHCLNYLRKERITPEFFEIPEDYQINVSPKGSASSDSIAQMLSEAMNNLPSHHQLIIKLYHYDNLTYEEIAQVMDVSEGTVKSRLFRARKLLKELLKSR